MKNGKRIFKKILLIFILILIIAILGIGYFIYSNIKALNPGKESPVRAETLDLTKRVNILLVGTDKRTLKEPGRSDSLILVSINPKDQTISMLSIPRDSRVEISTHGYDKINAAHNSLYYKDGGMKLTLKTVENLLGVKVPYYVEVNFRGFEKIVDSIGGVDIEVEKRMFYDSGDGDTRIDLKPGLQHLDGKKALEYARFRNDAYGDYALVNGKEEGRIARQKKLINAVIDQSITLRNLTNLVPLINSIQEAVETNITPPQMLKLALLLKNIDSSKINTIIFPATLGYVDNISYVLPDFEKLKEIGSLYFSSN